MAGAHTCVLTGAPVYRQTYVCTDRRTCVTTCVHVLTGDLCVDWCTCVSTGVPVYLVVYLCIEWELVELEVLEEAALDASPLVHRRLAFHIELQLVPQRLVRFT